MREKNVFSRIQIVLAWGLIPLAYLAWCLFTVSYKSDVFAYAGTVVGETAILMYGFLAHILMNAHENTVKELSMLNGLLAVISVLLGGFGWSEFETRFLPEVYLMVLTVLIVCIILIRKHVYGNVLISIMRWIKAHYGILAVALVTLLLSLDSDMYQFKWDGLLYYDAVKQASLESVSSVALYGHVAIGSGAFYRFFVIVFRDIAVGMIAANIFVLVMAVLAVYGIVKTIIPDRNEVVYCLAAGGFAFSPFLLGMVNYFSTDWFCVCIVVILLYFVFKKQWVFTTIVACVFCLSKEPALIAYTGMCFGMVLSDILAKGKWGDKILELLKTVHYYYMLIPYFLWFGTYKILGQWNAGSGGFSFDPGYSVDKLKVFFLFNFNWIFTLLIIVGTVKVIKDKGITERMWWLLPLVMSNLFLLIFNVLFKTANHPRYIDSFVSVNIVLAVLLTLLWFKEKVASIICGVVAVIGLISCYVTFDPVSLMVFNHADTGRGQILYTAAYPLGDGSIYNKQMLHMEKLYSKAITDAMEDGSAVVIPTVSNSVYAVDGMSETIGLNDPAQKETQYWDVNKNRRVPYASEHVNESKEMTIYHIAGECNVDDTDCDSDLISVIYIKGINDYNYSDSYEKIDSVEYSYLGWVMTRDILIRK